MSDRRAMRGLGLAALAVVAAVYFSATTFSTIERTDEGQMVYPSWLVARGETPYVDFQHLYGPSLFFLNGALLRLFGEDLRVIRLSVITLKVLVVVLVYALARLRAPRSAALLVTGFLTCVWGMPIWLFNAPYATYHTTVLCLAGLLLASTGRATPQILAAFCFGVAATFKQTQGLFAFLALVLSVIFAVPGGAARRSLSGPLRWGAGIARVLALGTTMVIGLVYMADHLWTMTAFVLLCPLAAAVVGLLVREVRRWPPGDDAVTSVGVLALASLAMLVPLAGYAVFYTSIGALDSLIYNTVAGLPQRFAWFVPFPVPDRRIVWLCAAIASSFGVLLGWNAWSREGRGRWVVIGPLAVLVASVGALLAEVHGPFGVRPYLLGGVWTRDFFLVLYWLPFVVIGAAVPALVGGDTGVDDERAPPERRHAVLALLCFFAIVNLMQLYPAADLVHTPMGLPAFLPLLAHGLGRLWRKVPAAVVLACFWLGAAAWPFVQPRLVIGAPPTSGLQPLPRASGIVGRDPRSEEAARLVRYLSDAKTRDGGFVVLTNEELLYFLVGTRSALPQEEFIFYLVGGDLIVPETARTLVDEEAVVDRLARSRPLVIDYVGSTEVARFRKAFPRVGQFIDARYEPVTAIGGYRVLGPRP